MIRSMAICVLAACIGALLPIWGAGGNRGAQTNPSPTAETPRPAGETQELADHPVAGTPVADPLSARQSDGPSVHSVRTTSQTVPAEHPSLPPSPTGRHEAAKTPPVLDEEQSKALSTAIQRDFFADHNLRIAEFQERQKKRKWTALWRVKEELKLQGLEIPKYGCGELELLDNVAVRCLFLGKATRSKVEFPNGARKLKDVGEVRLDFNGLGLVFPDGFSSNRVRFPAPTVVWYRAPRWQVDSRPEAFEQVLAKLSSDIEKNAWHLPGRQPVGAAGWLGPAAKPVVPALVKALAGERSVAGDAAESLQQITGQEFGRDKAKWEAWCEQSRVSLAHTP